jgi:diacylglycerol kinase family enzyme
LINKKWEFKSFCTDKDNVSEQVRDLCEQGYNRIIVAGGDGTVREVINGIMISTRDPVVGIIPRGTGNDLARALGYYKRFVDNPLLYLDDLTAGIEKPKYRFCRVLSLNGKVYFANYLGIGFDARIARKFHENRSLPLYNRLIYLICIINSLPFKVKEPIRISFKDTESRRYKRTIENFKNLLLINIPSYAGGLVKIGDIDLKGRAFHLMLMNGILEMIFFLLRGKLPEIFLSGRKFEAYKTDEAEISLPHNKVFIQIDGEDFTDCLGSLKKLTIKTAGRIRFFL